MQKPYELDTPSGHLAPGLVLRGGRPREAGEILDGKLRLGRVLGAGGMGTVYEATDLALGRPVAVKLLHPFLAAGSGLARFRREAQAAAGLQHDNIVSVHEFGVAPDGTAFIVMELLQGEDMRRLMGHGTLAPADAARTIADVAQGLAVAHRGGIVHRDLKPENIFMCRRQDGRAVAKVLDFGVAKLPSADSGATTATGVALGTPHYMAPEQARGAKDIDHRVDLYALGVILYEALSGHKPHRGSSYNAILFNILHTPPEPLRKLRRDLPGAICDVVERAMAYAPRDRLGSAEELVTLLEPIAAGHVQVTPPPRAASGARAIGLGGSEATPPAITTRPVELQAGIRRGAVKRWVTGAALAAAASLGTLAVVTLRRPAPAPAPAGAPTTMAAPAPAAQPASAAAPAPVEARARPVAAPATDHGIQSAAARPSRRTGRKAPPAREPQAPPAPRAAATNPEIDRVNPYDDAQER